MRSTGMLDGVLHKLGNRHGQRGGDIRAECAALTVTLDLHPIRPERRGQITHESDDPVHHISECDVPRATGGQEIVDNGDGSDPHFRFGEHILRLIPRRSTALQTQKCRNRLQIVLHAMVDFLDRGIFAQQLAITPSGLRDITEQHHRAITEWHGSHQNRDILDVDIDTSSNLPTGNLEK